MLRKVAEYIKKEKLLKENDRVIVALSGGADSVALLHILHKLGFDILAVHCNFHLRGEESMRDQYFAKTLCKRLGITIKIIDFDTEEHARKNKISIEMAARELRYTAFEQIRAEERAAAIAVAHHRNDSAETLLLNLMRGCGIKGLHGIRPKNGFIIRPLLTTDREEILKYLENEHEEYVTDSSNLKTDYTRNKVRLELLPIMSQINPSIVETLAVTAERIAWAEDVYRNAIEESINRIYDEGVIDIDSLKKEKSPQTILHEILSPLGFNSTQVGEIFNNLNGESGRRYQSKEWEVVKDRNKLITHPIREEFKERILLPDEGNVGTPYGTLEIRICHFNGEFSKSAGSASLDIEKLHMPLTLRRTAKGDRFHPYGMRGTKLVSDYLTDRKRSIIDKEQQLVVTDAQGNIVWLVGERPAAPYCINKDTKMLLCLYWEKTKKK